MKDCFDSQLERNFFEAMKQSGLEFGSNPEAVFGKPDFVLRGRNIAVFVHGCFWHRHHSCANSRVPKTNVETWSMRLNKTVFRDKQVRDHLSKEGWTSVIVWECSIKKDLVRCVNLINCLFENEEGDLRKKSSYII